MKEGKLKKTTKKHKHKRKKYVAYVAQSNVWFLHIFRWLRSITMYPLHSPTSSYAKCVLKVEQEFIGDSDITVKRRRSKNCKLLLVDTWWLQYHYQT